MRRKLIAATVGGLVLGLLGTLFWRHSDAVAQQPPPKVSYEFKVVEFGTGFLNTETADDMTKKLNKLADEGWEYVGPLASPADDKRFVQGFVAFRRAKK